MSLRHTLLRSAVRCLLLAQAVPILAATPDYETYDEPGVDAAEQSGGLMDEFFEEEMPEPSLFPGFKKRLETAPPFWRDSTLSFRPRSYYLSRDRDGAPDSEAWAIGGALDFESGWWRDRLRMRAVLYTSQKVSGPSSKDGTLLLKPGQESFSVLGQAYVEAKLAEGLFARAGRTEMNLPYVNKQDSRMVPNTFEAYGAGGDLTDRLRAVIGHVRKMKKRNSDEFVYMSEAAGVDDSDEPLTLAGLRYAHGDSWNIGAVNHYAWNLMNTFYAEVNAAATFAEDITLAASAQYTDQQSVGDELDGDFDTWMYGARLSATYGGATLSLAASGIGDGSRIRSPFGGYPGYLSSIIKDFNRADEDAWLIGMSYDFAGHGIPGLSAFANYIEGDTPVSGVNASPDQTELDITVDYRFQERKLKGLWLRLRRAWVDQSGPGAIDEDDVRIIVNYELPIL